MTLVNCPELKVHLVNLSVKERTNGQNILRLPSECHSFISHSSAPREDKVLLIVFFSEPSGLSQLLISHHSEKTFIYSVVRELEAIFQLFNFPKVNWFKESQQVSSLNAHQWLVTTYIPFSIPINHTWHPSSNCPNWPWVSPFYTWLELTLHHFVLRIRKTQWPNKLSSNKTTSHTYILHQVPETCIKKMG